MPDPEDFVRTKLGLAKLLIYDGNKSKFIIGVHHGYSIIRCSVGFELMQLMHIRLDKEN